MKPDDKRPPPLTAAQRQSRHRQKKKAAFAELLAQATNTGQLPKLQRENAHLRAQLEALQRKHAEQADKLRSASAQQPAMRDQMEALRLAVRTLLAQLSPAAISRARKHLAETGFIEWLDAD